MDDQQALRELAAWLADRLPAASTPELAEHLRRFRAQGLNRRLQARRLFAKAISERLPEDDRADGLVVVQWLLGLRWLPPPVSDLEPPAHSACARNLF